MGRPTKKNEAEKQPLAQKNKEEVKVAENKEPKATPETPKDNQESKPQSSNKNDREVPGKVIELMKLYSHFEEIWVTPNGFVHHKNAPAYLTKGATLYKNQFYKN